MDITLIILIVLIVAIAMMSFPNMPIPSSSIEAPQKGGVIPISNPDGSKSAWIDGEYLVNSNIKGTSLKYFKENNLLLFSIEGRYEFYSLLKKDFIKGIFTGYSFGKEYYTFYVKEGENIFLDATTHKLK